MEPGMVFVVVLANLIGTASAQSQTVTATENPIQVGNNVTLNSSENVTLGTWTFEGDIVVFIAGGNYIKSDDWTDRVAYNLSTSSLTITSLKVEDSGDWKLQSADGVFRASLDLSVQVPISNVTLTANETNLVEFDDAAVLRCSVSNGTNLVYTWMNGTSVVTANDRIQFSDGGAVLTMNMVTRYDQGPFKCNVSNGISRQMSSSVALNISYGPSNMTVTVTPEDYAYITGSNITLHCSADSKPPAVFKWLFNDEDLNHSGPMLRLEGVAVSNAGNYKCSAYNSVTSRTSNKTAMIRILAPIASAEVNTGEQAINGREFTLHCAVNGTFDNIQWLRNSLPLSADNTTVFGTDNRTLTLNPVKRSDDGDYQCFASNYVSNKISAPYTVRVNYGPMTPTISGASSALTGTNEMLNCSSDSVPASHYNWTFGSITLALNSTLTIGPLTLNMTGEYVCTAFNDVTGRSSNASHMLTVYEPVTMASVKIVGAQPILNRTFTLRCETIGSVVSIIWKHGGYPLSAGDSRYLSMDNTTLMFIPIKFSDNGNYWCEASNPLSSNSTSNFTLDVRYGPETPTVTGPPRVKMGNSVTLSCNASSNPPSSYAWFYDGSQVANTSEYVSPPLNRETNTFMCQAYNNITGEKSMSNITVTAIAPITDVQVEASMEPPVEGRSYQLSCAVTGPADGIYWMKDGEILHGDSSTVFDMGNKTVTMGPLHRSDDGGYQCSAWNVYWNKTSEAYSLQVDFGPDTPVIQGPHVAEIGQTVNFSCSALSMPPSRLSWHFNNSVVSNTSVFTSEVSSLDMGGEYTCEAYNNVTGNYSSASKSLLVREATVVMVRNSTAPIDSRNFTLICEVVGPYDRIYWMKNNVSLDTDNMTAGWWNNSHHMENNTLTFTPVTRLDDGSYQCVAENDAGSHASPAYMLQVNYGPLSVAIVGPDSLVPEGYIVTLKCIADSVPTCDYQWTFANPSVVLQTGQVLIFPASKINEGEYRCVATNPVTGIIMTATKNVALDHASSLHVPSLARLMLLGVFALSVSVLFN